MDLTSTLSLIPGLRDEKNASYKIYFHPQQSKGLDIPK